MNLTTAIEMDPDEAARRAEAYKSLQVPTPEERRILAGFLALAAGRQVIALAETVRAGGADEKGWPKLAVMRADQQWCHLTATRRGHYPGNGGDWETTGVNWRFDNDPGWRTVGPTSHLRFEIAGPDLDFAESAQRGYRSQVPIVPPELRPSKRNSTHGKPIKLSNFVVLWEVEEWAEAPRPPGDPALLRHLAGDLWTVEAVWDLSELERMVLGMRETP